MSELYFKVLRQSVMQKESEENKPVFSGHSMKAESVEAATIEESLDDYRESFDEESSLSNEEKTEKMPLKEESLSDYFKREPLSDEHNLYSKGGRNGRSEENGNPQRISDLRLQHEKELIYRKLIETGDITKLRTFLMKKLYLGDWKHLVLKLCRDAIKGNKAKSVTSQNNQSQSTNQKCHPITFQDLYSSIKEEAKKKVSDQVRQRIFDEVKLCYYKDSV